MEQTMDRRRLLSDIERYWLETGVPSGTATEMRRELEQHIADAAADGRNIEDVIGRDPAVFAESWAGAYRKRRTGTASWSDVQTGAAETRRKNRRELTLFGLGTVAVIAAVAVASQGGNDVDNEVWRWFWTIFAVVMGIGEMFTAGFFLLPFAIGAAAAAILAWVGAGALAQWLVFFGLSVFSLAYLRRFINRQDEGEQPKVGANRWIGETGIVLADVDPDTTAGMVRILHEEWRASADQHIDAGTRVIVTDVQGTRLVVEPVESL